MNDMCRSVSPLDPQPGLMLDTVVLSLAVNFSSAFPAGVRPFRSINKAHHDRLDQRAIWALDL